MNNNNYLISVVIPIYNGAKYIKKSLDSIINQTYQNIEIIVVDDGSTDNSNDILNHTKKKDKRIKVIKNITNFGITKSLNIGVMNARGVFIVRQDIDEISNPKRIEKQINYLLFNNLVLAGSNCINIYPNGFKTIWGYYDQYKIINILKYRSPFPHGTTIFRKSIYLKCFGYDEYYKTSQDFDLWRRMKSFGKIGMIPETLVERNIDNNSISKNKKIRQAYDSTLIRMKNINPIYLPQLILFSLFSLLLSFLPNGLFYLYAKLRKKII